MLKKLLFLLLFLPIPVLGMEVSVEEFNELREQPLGAITGDSWNLKISTYLQPASISGVGLLIYGTNKYVSFGSTYGNSGYGIRDNSGTLQVKNSGGSWANFATGSGTVSSVDMSVPLGLEVSGNPITTAGTLAVTYLAGYEGMLTASSTNWNAFYNTPSTVITDGTGLTWSTNTLNCDTASGSIQGCLTSTDWTTFNNKWDDLSDIILTENYVFRGNASDNPEATNSLVILSGGNVGIGTATPNNLLSVYELIDFNNTDKNTKIGYQAGLNIVSTAVNNTFIGYQTGLASSTASTNEADYNTAIGYLSFSENTTGSQNTAIGQNSLLNNTTGDKNTGIGRGALTYNTEGNQNVAVGESSIVNNLTGNYNIGIGINSLQTLSTGSYNIGIGLHAGNATNGSNNIFLGDYAGAYETGSDSFYINNQDRTNTAGDKTKSLLYGTMAVLSADQNLTINAHLNVTGTSTFTGISTFADKVGIGTTTPSYVLDVYGTARVDGVFSLTDLATAAGTFVAIDSTGQLIATTTPTSTSVAGTDTQIQYNNGGIMGGSASLIYDDGNNFVGVASSTPTYLLSVGNSAWIETTGSTTVSQLTIDSGYAGTTTAQFGQAGNPYCGIFRDTDDGGFSYTYYLNGVQYVSTDSCE